MPLLTTFKGETVVDADWIAKTPAIDVAREVAALRKHLMQAPSRQCLQAEEADGNNLKGAQDDTS